jgi:hypothetical protein
MAQYKVLQDIEAEDKLLGPLSLRQFIYAAIVIVIGFIGFKLGTVQPLLAIPFIPPLVFFGLLAAPFGGQQSSEVWLLAKIKFFVFPRQRIWDQEGLQELVTITAPKPKELPAMKNFGKEEAQSRLKALASTMDTRGWAIKNLNTPGYVNPYNQNSSSDRLLELQTTTPDDIANVKPNEDVLDTSNPLSQAMNSMVAQNGQAHRQAMLQKMQTIAAQQHSQAQSQLQQPVAAPATPAVQTVVTPKPVPQAPVPTPQIHTWPSATPAAQPAQTAVTQAQAPAILEEVKSPPLPTELRVKDAPEAAGDDASEVVVSLH